MDRNSEYDLYKNLRERCGGEIYIGVVGPVRTGKSTFNVAIYLTSPEHRAAAARKDV